MSFDKVVAENFYKDNGDKIKLNWCLYEYSNVLYTKIAESSQLARYRKIHSEDAIVTFCVYFSKRLRKSIFDMQISRKNGIVFDGRYVYEFYPENSYAQTQRLLDAALAAWEEHILVCSGCLNKCLTNAYEITDMFDNLEKTGWPTR